MRTRSGHKALGLCALMTGVMAFGATGLAQAENGACWGYKSGASLLCFSTSLEAKPLITIENTSGLHPTAATLLAGSKNIEITCTTAAVILGGTLSANGSILLGQVLFGGCFSRTKTTLALLGVCEPSDLVDGPGTIVSEKGLGLIVLHNGEPVLELKPDTGTILAKILLGDECAVGHELIVEGKLILQDAGGKASFETHKLTHLIREFPGLQLMKVGGVLATIDGTANLTLAAPHNTLEWAGRAA